MRHRAAIVQGMRPTDSSDRTTIREAPFRGDRCEILRVARYAPMPMSVPR
jgi:hypothetical protein